MALLRWLPDELAGAASELDSRRRAVLLDELTARELVPLLDELYDDDAADVCRRARGCVAKSSRTSRRRRRSARS